MVDSLRTPQALLCAARSYPAAHAGSYELPGGKVEVGERPKEALARELMEEIALEVRLGPEVVPTSELAVAPPAHRSAESRSLDAAEPWPGDDAPAWSVAHGYRMRVWLAEPADLSRPARCGQSHESLDWVALEQIGSLPWLEADLPIVAALGEVLDR